MEVSRNVDITHILSIIKTGSTVPTIDAQACQHTHTPTHTPRVLCYVYKVTAPRWCLLTVSRASDLVLFMQHTSCVSPPIDPCWFMLIHWHVIMLIYLEFGFSHPTFVNIQVCAQTEQRERVCLRSDGVLKANEPEWMEERMKNRPYKLQNASFFISWTVNDVSRL